MNQDNTTEKGELSPGTSSDVKIELTKKLLITIPVKSKERDDVDEVTEEVVQYMKEKLKYEIHRVEHYAHRMKGIVGFKNKDLSEEWVEDQYQSPERKIRRTKVANRESRKTVRRTERQGNRSH